MRYQHHMQEVAEVAEVLTKQRIAMDTNSLVLCKL